MDIVAGTLRRKKGGDLLTDHKGAIGFDLIKYPLRNVLPRDLLCLFLVESYD